MKGSIVWFNETKGYGFIKCPENGKDIFVHISGVNPRIKLPEGLLVSFDISEGPKGKQAINVKKV